MNYKIKHVIKIILLIFFGTSFIIGTIMSFKTILENNKANMAYDDIRLKAQANSETDISSDKRWLKTMDFDALKEINNEIVAWINVEKTTIDYPILHTDNNDYYLNHLYNKEVNYIGSIFIDYRNNNNFTDKNTIIYGHYVKGGEMFTPLEQYKQQEFYDSHKEMKIYTPYGDYKVELISGTIEDGNEEFVRFDFKDKEEFINYIAELKQRSTFKSDVNVIPEDRIITLCTCSFEKENARYMIIGRLVPMVSN